MTVGMVAAEVVVPPAAVYADAVGVAAVVYILEGPVHVESKNIRYQELYYPRNKLISSSFSPTVR